jgi:hypothetical protein
MQNIGGIMFSEEIKRCVEKFYERAAGIRRQLHQNPELSEQEAETADLVANTLRESGIETRTGIAGNGVLGLIRGGKTGKTLLFRADMDAPALLYPVRYRLPLLQNIVSIQSPAGDSENRRNEGAFSPEMSRLGAKGGGSPLCKSTRGQKKF